MLLKSLQYLYQVFNVVINGSFEDVALSITGIRQSCMYLENVKVCTQYPSSD